MCAGVTTFNALRNSGARPGDTVAIVGIGGLGHLAVQFAAKSGYRTVAIARGSDKAPLASQLGAHVYIDNQAQDPAAELQKVGGAKIILSTVTAADAIEAVAGGVKEGGTLLVIGERAIKGWPSGTGMDSEDTLNFSALTGIRPQTEVFPLEKAAEGYERMMSGKARFRAVLTTGA
jgi:D-arabinose 1-dehydrogenase-like Zn-dependent alcohol dehydrogenase